MNSRTIAPLAADDYSDWSSLYRGYAAFYRQPMTDAVLTRVWQWVAEGRLHGAIARNAGTAIGIVHWEYILRPLRGATLVYLHDLYVHEHWRGRGGGGALLAHVGRQAKAHGCEAVRWLTKADNTRARRLYDKTATAAADWVLYQQTLTKP